MLSFDIRSLEREAAAVDAVLPANDDVWIEEDVLRPVREGVRVTGRLSSAGSGRYYFSGHLSGVTQQECRRCLVAVESEVDADVHVLFAEPGGEDEDDPDVYPLEGARGDLIDLRQAVREQWLLEVPAFSVCRPDCRGLCPKCGADLNAGACGCAPDIDDRWDALRKIRDASE
jgi:uncharacterized protein